MGNDFGALANSTLVHDLMDDFRIDMGPLLGLAMNIGDVQANGAVVRTMRPGTTLTITNYFGEVAPYQVSGDGGAGGYVAQDYEVGDPVTVTCPSDPWARSVKLTAEEYRLLVGGPDAGRAYQDLRAKLNLEMMYSLKKKMVQDFFAVITAANYTNNTVSGAGTFARSTEIDIETELFTRNIKDRSNAKLILHPTAYGEWAKDHVAINTNTGGSQAQRVMGDGVQSQVSSFQVHRTNMALPADAARGFAYTKTAALFINRIPDEPGLEGMAIGNDAFNSLSTVIDPASGIAFLFRCWKNWSTGAIQLDMASIWKFAKLQGEAIERITAA
jgi:hypothetical protein